MTRLTDTDTPAGEQMRGLLDALTTGSYHLIGDLVRAFEDMDAARTAPAYGAAMGHLIKAVGALEEYVARIDRAGRHLQLRDAVNAIDATHGTVMA